MVDVRFFILKQEQLISEIGLSGHLTGSRCHFDVIQNGVRVDTTNFYIGNIKVRI